MDKAQLITFWFLMKADTTQLNSVGDYVKQFNVVEEHVRDVLKSLSEEQPDS